jgi:zinc transporter, ZIP family
MEFERLLDYDPVVLALFATLFAWSLTALGASMVFFFKSINKRLLNSMLGFAAGVMIAASYWSLLSPAIALAETSGEKPWLPAISGFLAGGVFLFLIDKLLPHLHMSLPTDKAEGIKTSWHRGVLHMLSIALHNIPEGLAIGIAFGALAGNPDQWTLGGAIALTIGIGLQNIPEGAAISIPLKRKGLSGTRAFNYGQFSGIIQPIAGFAGAYLVIQFIPVLPYAFSFAAGAMIFVVVEEIIPESQSGNETDFSTVGAMLGFATMMLLDAALR